jgi:hypothetical protein
VLQVLGLRVVGGVAAGTLFGFSPAMAKCAENFSAAGILSNALPNT